jgi:serine/threonine protein kinase
LRWAARLTAQIGPYRLLQLLDVGGMGEVWLAEQKAPIHRIVALKLIKTGMDTKAVVSSFQSERQALALMDHPTIARVFDAGSTPEGRPYFVMEYGPELPVARFPPADSPGRVRWQCCSCTAKEFGFRKGTVRRDIKAYFASRAPKNGPHDAEGPDDIRSSEISTDSGAQNLINSFVTLAIRSSS